MQHIWAERLFEKSVLKQTKFRRIVELLGPTDGRYCLDIGSDNGTFCYMLRKQGGFWKSADLDERSVQAMRSLVQTDVYRIDGGQTPFETDEFDAVIIVDFLEHIPDDQEFMNEIYRILKPGGSLILNAPHVKNGLLIKFRNLIGMTDAIHGHLRPGYTRETVNKLLGDNFTLELFETHTKFFSKFMDTLMVAGLGFLKRKKVEKTSGRGILMTGDDMENFQAMFKVYSLIYPVVWFFSKLDSLLFFRTGYMLIASAKINKTPDWHLGTQQKEK